MLSLRLWSWLRNLYSDVVCCKREVILAAPWILADRTNGRAYGTMLCPSVCRLSVGNV